MDNVKQQKIWHCGYVHQDVLYEFITLADEDEMQGFALMKNLSCIEVSTYMGIVYCVEAFDNDLPYTFNIVSDERSIHQHLSNLNLSVIGMLRTHKEP